MQITDDEARGKHYVEYLLSNSDSLVNVIASCGIKIPHICIYTHSEGKIYYINNDGHRNVIVTIGSITYFRIDMFTQKYRILHQIMIPFHVLSNGAFISVNDMEVQFTRTYDSDRQLKNNIILKELVHSWITTNILKHMILERVAIIKEELVAAVWHPRRVAKLLEEGGWEAVDAL